LPGIAAPNITEAGSKSYIFYGIFAAYCGVMYIVNNGVYLALLSGYIPKISGGIL
jgi:hypothetical protein